MANQLFDTGRQKFLNGEIDYTNDDIRIVLVDTNDHTFTFSEEFLSDITAAGLIGENGTALTNDTAINTDTPSLANKTSTAGVADADDVVLTAVSGDQAEALVIFKWTGVSTTSPLIAYIDTATGLPVTPNGGDITIAWDSGANKIFKL